MENLCDVIAIVFGFQLAWSYYRDCRGKGYTIDVWHLAMMQMYFVVHAMLPFSRSKLNFLALGGLLPRTQERITQAYLISALGYAAVLLGGFLWRVRLGMGVRQRVARLLEIPAGVPRLLLRNKSLLVAHGVMAVTLLVCVLGYYFKLSGFGFNLRGLLLTYPALRPVAQFTAFYSVLIGSLCLARYAVFREGRMLVIVGAVLVGLLFFGERGNMVTLFLLAATVGFLRMGRRLKPLWLAGGLIAVLFAVFALNALREPNFTLQNGLARFGFETFYGNSFSDTRDFALVLSFWDGHYFYGMTYLAGLLAFIPRFLSPFRDHWAIGVVTASMAGYSPQQHSGLRPGAFGEAFLNFGLVGVVLLGIAVGAMLRFIDLRMKQALHVLPARSLRVYTYYILFMVIAAVQISANASAVYSVLLLFLLSWVFLRVTTLLKMKVAGT